MNPSSFLPHSFSMELPVTTYGDGTDSHVTGFPTNDDHGSQRVGGLTSMPVNNGVRYHAQQPAMQDLGFPGSSALAMTPQDPGSDSFAPASGPLFPHPNQQQHSFDRSADFRRMPPALQPPPGMATGMQAPAPAVNSIPALAGRSNAYSYGLHGNMGFPLAGGNEFSRAHQYSGTAYSDTPRALEPVVDRSSSAIFPQPIVESAQRPSAHAGVPRFEDTDPLKPLMVDVGGTRTEVTPDVHAKIVKGFFHSGGNWTCYRRNYFAVGCSFSLSPWHKDGQLYVLHSDQGTWEPIRGFAMNISAIVNGSYEETRELVQHTPKRDKQSERKPTRVALQPSPSPTLAAGSTVGNGSHSGFGLGSQSLEYNSSFPGVHQQAQQLPTSYTFERIQFQKATANNGKRRAQQQYYNLVVELHGEVANPMTGESQWIQVARRRSDKMVVRGRSPGHYKDGRRESTASITNGDGVDDMGGGFHRGIGQAARSHLLMYDSAHRGGLPYGRTDYRQMSKAGSSPLSDSPLISSSSSSGFEYSMMNDTMDPMDTLKSDYSLKPESTLDPYQDPGFAGVSNHPRPSTGGYDPVYSTYGRYDPIRNPQSLCT